MVLAVPELAVGSCLAVLKRQKQPPCVLSVATNITREMLRELGGENFFCLNVKIIGHAGEMSRGARPVVVVDLGEAELVEMARQLFVLVGVVVVGEADQVQIINRIATEKALEAAVAIENELCEAGIADREKLRGALAQVAPGVMKAYAEDDLGPFARGVVCALRDKAKTQVV